MKHRNIIIFAGIYLVALAFMLNYNLTHAIVNDAVYEYYGYILNIEETWLYRYSSINSCLVSIWFPAMIQRITGWDPMILFRVFPPIFYALVPAFVFLIARIYFGVKDSLVTTLVVSLSSYILFFPDVGRVGVALGLIAALMWALLHKKLLTSMVLALLVVYAHYGATIIAIGMVGALLASRLIWDRSSIKVTVASFCTLLAFTGAWHFGISHYSGDSMLWTMLHPGEARGVLQDFIPGVRVDIPQGTFFELESRDYVTQEAFGKNFATNSVPLKIEIIINWIVVGFITLGLYRITMNKAIDKVYKAILLTMYGLTAASVIVPAISVFYGTQRVYFTALLMMAVGFPAGIKWVSGKIPLNPMWLTAIVLIIYGASTSGLIYPIFGLTKTIPVVLTYP